MIQTLRLRANLLPIFTYIALIACWLSCAHLCFALPQTEKETAEAHLAQARTAFEDNNYELAKIELRRAQTLRKNYADAYYQLAVIYHLEFNRAEALKEVTSAVNYRPTYPEAHQLKAVLLFENLDYNRAAEEINLALAQGVRNAEAFGLAGDLKLATRPTKASKEPVHALVEDNTPENRLFYESVIAIYQRGIGSGATDAAGQKLQLRIDALKDHLSHLGKKPAPAAANDSSGNRPFKVLSRINPPYTPEAKEHKEQGVVVFGIFFGADGTIVSAFIIKGLKYGLNEEAMNSIHTISFQPAMKDGKLVSSYARVTANFVLRK